MDLRRYTRYVVDFPTYLFTEGFSDLKPIGSGRVVNLCEHGYKVTSDTTVYTGDHLALRFYAPHLRPPVSVHNAVVRWVSGEDFGLEFLSMQEGDWERLRQFTKTLKPKSQPLVLVIFAMPNTLQYFFL